MSDLDWEFINSFAPWFSAIGTILAVILSLYYATRDRKIQLKVGAHRAVLVKEAFENRCTEYMIVTITNCGPRTATITGVFWQYFPLCNKFYRPIDENEGYSSKLPSKIEDGEQLLFYYVLSKNSINELYKTIGAFPKLKLFFMKVRIETSIGKAFTKRADFFLRRLLMKKKTS
jgi:hypothetical protein